MAAKSAEERAQEFAQKAIACIPVVILGSGASAAHNVPGMGSLAKHLETLPVAAAWDATATAEWSKFCGHIQAGTDLESALGAVRLTDEQTAFVADATREFLLPSDLAAFELLLSNRRAFPLTRLYRHLFSSTHRTLHVVTPNYDRLAEYAADAGEFSHFTGFAYGHMQTRAKDAGTRIHYSGEAARTVCIWKVHGSLDWFRDDSQQIIAARSCIRTPKGYVPLMVTPGIDKYRLTHGEPFRTIFACSDASLEQARAYLCVGYGFNDSHVQEKLVERCDAHSTPVVIVTHGLTPTTKKFLSSGRCRQYLAIESSPGGARLYSHLEPAGFEVAGKPLWKFDQFLDFAIGAA